MLVCSYIIHLVTAVARRRQRQFVAARYGAQRQKDNAHYDSEISHVNKNRTFCIPVRNYYNNMVAILGSGAG